MPEAAAKIALPTLYVRGAVSEIVSRDDATAFVARLCAAHDQVGRVLRVERAQAEHVAPVAVTVDTFVNREHFLGAGCELNFGHGEKGTLRCVKKVSVKTIVQLRETICQQLYGATLALRVKAVAA